MGATDEQLELLARVQALESKIERLRFSRRILMNLVAKMEEEKWNMVDRLERENHRLRNSNSLYAKVLWQKNTEIINLMDKLNR